MSTAAARSTTAATAGDKAAARTTRTTATALRATTTGEVTLELALRTLAALLDLELNTVDGMGVGGKCGLVSGSGLKVNESSVLDRLSAQV